MSFSTFFSTPPPAVALEIAASRVSAAALRGRNGRFLVALASEPLPHGAVVPAMNARNIPAQDVVSAAIKRVFARLGVKSRRVALVVPDTVGKVSMVRLQAVPARRHELDQLLRFHVRKSAPFRIEEAEVAYSGRRSRDGGHEFTVVVTQRGVVQEYEEACFSAGAHAGIVDLSTFGLIDGVLAAPSRPVSDWLLVHVTSSFATIAVMRGAELLFFRNREGCAEDELVDLVHQTVMYHQDRLGGERFDRVILAGVAAAAPNGETEHRIRRAMESRLATVVEAVDPTPMASLAERASPDQKDRDLLAPLLGLLLRERPARAGAAG
jgi:Tfp pilus assembly PilM family ATPase